jgi:hypothetical protein
MNETAASRECPIPDLAAVAELEATLRGTSGSPSDAKLPGHGRHMQPLSQQRAAATGVVRPAEPRYRRQYNEPCLSVAGGTGNTQGSKVATAAGSARDVGKRLPTPEEAQTMRVDLIPERDRFIPGWHSQPDTQRAEFTSPEWQWPSRLCRAVWAFLSSLLHACQVAPRSRAGSPRSLS